MSDYCSILSTSAFGALSILSGPSATRSVFSQWRYCVFFLFTTNQIFNFSPQGHRQSPLNVVPSELLFDPGLDPIYINQNQVTLQQRLIWAIFVMVVWRWRGEWSTLDIQPPLGLIDIEWYQYKFGKMLTRVDQGHHHLVNISGADLSYHYQVICSCSIQKRKAIV